MKSIHLFSLINCYLIAFMCAVSRRTTGEKSTIINYRYWWSFLPLADDRRDLIEDEVVQIKERNCMTLFRFTHQCHKAKSKGSHYPFLFSFQDMPRTTIAINLTELTCKHTILNLKLPVSSPQRLLNSQRGNCLKTPKSSSIFHHFF